MTLEQPPSAHATTSFIPSMKLLQLLISCTAALAAAAPSLHDLPATSLQVRNSGNAVADSHGSSLVRLLSRDSTEAYEEAARAAGGSLSSGTYYYFMNCALGPAQSSVPLVQWANSAHGCSHVGLVVGKTARFGVKKFKAVYIHIRLWDTGFYQSQRDYTPYEDQKLVYGGTTTSSKADLNRLVDAGNAWLEDAGYELTEEHNCVAHYQYLASLL
ncbi:uncharacterized protein CLUP02_17394 [Colletotrichum lupini]|uniref:Uncharacterized protein n=1 Tax=Colletotrichum lupini TaxID=145971 RepID=A0A9Q8SER4_9PEZI|nr:uncharacterized protein CLUP02_17394 [Colletotrichum lupini]UQC75885.1 hypothetical protein CLUP02_17394 [Colletotrichum lupini]